MAKLTGTVPGFPELGKDILAGIKVQEAALKILEDRSEALPLGDLVGGVIRFQVADGYALYLVSKAPVGGGIELQHIPYCDGYSIPAAHIRGLTKADILEMLRQEKACNKLFNKKE